MYSPALFVGEHALMYHDDKLHFKETFLNLVYPIGSIYITTDSTKNPATLFGGTWISIKDTFMYAADPDNPPSSDTGGSATHTLTIDEMPSHTHTSNPGVYHRDNNVGLTKVNVDYPCYGDFGSYETSATGGGQPFSIMPPYRVVYVYERTE